jgi:hypothetical protein
MGWLPMHAHIACPLRARCSLLRLEMREWFWQRQAALPERGESCTAVGTDQKLTRTPSPERAEVTTPSWKKANDAQRQRPGGMSARPSKGKTGLNGFWSSWMDSSFGNPRGSQRTRLASRLTLSYPSQPRVRLAPARDRPVFQFWCQAAFAARLVFHRRTGSRIVVLGPDPAEAVVLDAVMQRPEVPRRRLA